MKHALPHGAKYVALGSSYGAGPGVGEQAADSPTTCARSNQNYAHLLAAKRGFVLTDRTCSGATTANILTTPQNGVPIQIDGVTADTQLVTVTVGGNDVSFLGNLWAESCRIAPEMISASWRAAVCKATSPGDVEAAVKTLPDHLNAVIHAIRERAPKAEIVFVSYLDPLPKTGSCDKRAPLSSKELEQARLLYAKLLSVTEAVTKAAGVTLVDAGKLTQGHDVCSDDPWVFPFEFSKDPETFGPYAYHPKLEAMQAIAQELDRILG